MAISEELKEIYTNYDDNREFYETIQLYHPNFRVQDVEMLPANDSYPTDTSYPNEFPITLNSHFLIRANESMSLEVEGEEVYFNAFPFNIVPPEQGSDQQDMALVMDNVSRELIQGIENASLLPDVPIEMTYRVYIEGSLESQITPVKLSLTNIVANLQTIQATATRSDLFARRFPYGNTTRYDNKFVGLYL